MTGCFVAGTLVHTDNGFVPIERIRVGDPVLSQPEDTGALAYKRVLNTFSFADKEVVTVDFADANCIGTAVATGNHPFFVIGVGWMRADQLRGGEVLVRHDGTTCSVFNVSPIFRTAQDGVGWIQGGFGVDDPDEELGRLIDLRHAAVTIDYDHLKSVPNTGIDLVPDNRLKVRVYNLEVEDHQTYYVGGQGVWVHNANCGGLPEQETAPRHRPPETGGSARIASFSTPCAPGTA